MARKVLLIDGDKDHAQALKSYMGLHQCQVTTAHTQKEMTRLLNKHAWDIIAADPFISKTTAPAILKHKKQEPRVQIIILTARENIDPAMELFELNALQYLEVPVNSKALNLALAQAGNQLSLFTRMDRYTTRLTDLHYARNMFNQLFEEVPCYISVQDKNLRVTATNGHFKRHFGNIIGGFCYELYKHRSSPCCECPVVRTFKDGKIHSTEEVLTSKSGKQVNALTQTAPIRNEDGEITHVMEMSTDITQIRQLQDHLVSLGLMLGSTSHGVKGMLTALDGGIYQMEKGLEKNDGQRVSMAFEQIREMAEKIKKMVLEILYYAKSRNLQYERVKVTDLCSSVVMAGRPMAQKYNIDLSVSMGEQLGIFEIDAKWLEAALINFLENAIDACVFDRTKQSHQVVFSVEKRSDEEICFTISDNGIGMDAETRNKMFTLFFTSKGSQGTGLGLFIAHRVIKYHGGWVNVESKPGEGSRFSIGIPLQKPENARILS